MPDTEIKTVLRSIELMFLWSIDVKQINLSKCLDLLSTEAFIITYHNSHIVILFYAISYSWIFPFYPLIFIAWTYLALFFSGFKGM